jgi:membrane protease YdiL (CAAX protease family)
VGGTLLAVPLGRTDAVVFLVVAAMFALAQSWDTRDRARTGDPLVDQSLEPGGVGILLRWLMPLVVPVTSAAAFGGFAAYLRTFPHSAAHLAAMRWCIAAAGACVLIAIPQVSRQLARGFMRDSRAGYTDRLTASLALVLLLIPVPSQLMIEELMDMVKGAGRPLADVGALVGQLIGEVVFALAAVGLWVGRDWKAVRERLGLTGMQARHVAIAMAGLAAVTGVNAGMEWIEQTQFHALWLRDQDTTKLIAGNLSLTATLVLGVSAGVGEEVMVRGALQPRVGLFWASLLFAAAHVQYTWFGMLSIAMIGLMLGTVRKTANTTTAIVVHMLYDIIAALGAR